MKEKHREDRWRGSNEERRKRKNAAKTICLKKPQENARGAHRNKYREKKTTTTETRTHTFTKLHENAGGASQEEETLTRVCK